MKDEIKKALEAARPGPWKFGNSEEGKRIVLGGSDNYVCNVQIYQTPRSLGYYDESTREANANLIANAPTWLRWQNERIEQLEKALETITSIKYDNLGYSPEDAQCMNDIARQALGKEE